MGCLLSILVVVTDPLPADSIERALDAHGSQRLTRATVAFVFRGAKFEVERDTNGVFRYARLTVQGGREIRDTLTNAGTTRRIDGTPVQLSPDEERAVAESLNSVVYFATLPFALQDAAVRSEELGSETIDGESYQRVRVSFVPESGGSDHDDVFIYWFHASRGTLDYLAYSYRRNGGGVRFRVAQNPRMVAGVRFQDYTNYRPASLDVELTSLPVRHQRGELIPVSTVKTEKVCVTYPERGKRCS